MTTAPSASARQIRDTLKSPGTNPGNAAVSLSVYIQEAKEWMSAQGLSQEDMEWAANARRFRIIFTNALIFIICFALIGLIVVGVYLLFSDQFFAPIAKFATLFMDARAAISAKYGAAALFFGDLLFAAIMTVCGAYLLRYTIFRKEVITYQE